MTEFATDRDLRALEDTLRKDIRDTERILRDRDDDKERGLRVEFVAAVQASENRTHMRLTDIDTHLSRQDEFIMRRRLAWPTWRRDTASIMLAAVGSSVFLHFLFGVG